MKLTEKSAIATIRAELGLKRLDPRRLYIIDDGAYSWIGDRSSLTAQYARDLSAINARGCRPDRHGPETTEGIDYEDICQRVHCVAASHDSVGCAAWENLPESWRDGSALGPISPL